MRWFLRLGDSGNRSVSVVGMTMVELMIAVVVFAIGIIPVFFLLSQSRRTTVVSINAMQATTLISSMIGALKAVPGTRLQPILGQELYDEQFPSNLSLPNLGIPPAPTHLKRKTLVRVVNMPSLPGERFSNPWGRIIEILVSVSVKPTGQQTDPDVEILAIKDYRVLEP